MRTIVLIIADTHACFKGGLLCPGVTLYERDQDGVLHPYIPVLNAIQEYFWKLLILGCQAVANWAAGDQIVVLHYGDITHGNRYATTLVSTELSDQITIAVANMEPLMTLPNVRSFRLVAGTDAHNFGDASAEKIIIDSLKLRYPGVNSEVVFHGLGSVDGVQIEYAHKGPYTGSRHHLKGNVAHQWLRDHMTLELLEGKVPPRLYGFGHYHEWIFVTETVSIRDEDFTSSVFVMPSFNFPNMWTTAAQRGQSRFTHGIVALEIVDGQFIRYKRFTRTIDRRTKENL